MTMACETRFDVVSTLSRVRASGGQGVLATKDGPTKTLSSAQMTSWGPQMKR